MQRISIVLLLILLRNAVAGQQIKEGKNLIPNGNFESGNTGFLSDYKFNPIEVNPGEYTITSDAGKLRKNLRSPGVPGHLDVQGKYLLSNASGKSGKKLWIGRVQVQPHSLYRFTFAFCNAYKYKPVYGIILKVNLSWVVIGDMPRENDPELLVELNGKKIGVLEKELYQVHRWVHSSFEWYSGSDSGSVTLSIENTNPTIAGNDVALDDMQFVYLEPMTKNAIADLPKYSDEIKVAEIQTPGKKWGRQGIFSLIDSTPEGTLAPGVYLIKQEQEKQYEPLQEGQKIVLKNLIFVQASAVLTAEAKKELDNLAAWMKENLKVKIRLEGYTDNVGNAKLNVKLSEDRVSNAREYLFASGVGKERVEIIGYGGQKPLTENFGEENRKLNRRIEMVILDQ